MPATKIFLEKIRTIADLRKQQKAIHADELLTTDTNRLKGYEVTRIQQATHMELPRIYQNITEVDPVKNRVVKRLT